jgi:hypothetical protein
LSKVIPSDSLHVCVFSKKIENCVWKLPQKSTRKTAKWKCRYSTSWSTLWSLESQKNQIVNASHLYANYNCVINFNLKWIQLNFAKRLRVIKSNFEPNPQPNEQRSFFATQNIVYIVVFYCLKLGGGG